MTRFLTPFNNTPALRAARGYTGREDLWDSLFGDVFGLTSGATAPSVSAFAANKTDIWEEDGLFKVAMDVPGMAEGDLDVTVNNGVLTVKAQKSEETSDEGKSFIQRERHVTSFERQIALPEGIDEEKVGAHLAHGVLTISLPKLETESKKMRKISITSGK